MSRTLRTLSAVVIALSLAVGCSRDVRRIVPVSNQARKTLEPLVYRCAEIYEFRNGEKLTNPRERIYRAADIDGSYRITTEEAQQFAKYNSLFPYCSR